MAQDDYTPIETRSATGRDADHPVVYSAEYPSQEGRFALALIERHGMAMTVLDGDKYRPGELTRCSMRPAGEVVARAFDLAELTFRELRRRGWMADIGLPDETSK